MAPKLSSFIMSTNPRSYIAKTYKLNDGVPIKNEDKCVKVKFLFI